MRSCGPEKKPEIAATQQALGESVKKGMDTKANAPKRGDSGLHYWFNYETNSKKNIPGYLPWKPDWQFGYTAAPQFKKEVPSRGACGSVSRRRPRSRPGWAG